MHDGHCQSVTQGDHYLSSMHDDRYRRVMHGRILPDMDCVNIQFLTNMGMALFLRDDLLELCPMGTDMVLFPKDGLRERFPAGMILSRKDDLRGLCLMGTDMAPCLSDLRKQITTDTRYPKNGPLEQSLKGKGKVLSLMNGLQEQFLTDRGTDKMPNL